MTDTPDNDRSGLYPANFARGAATGMEVEAARRELYVSTRQRECGRTPSALTLLDVVDWLIARNDWDALTVFRECWDSHTTNSWSNRTELQTE